MLTLSQIADLRDYLDRLRDNISETIRTKPVLRESKTFGDFQAPVNATGNLANSIEYVIGNNEIQILANDYVDKLIYGQAPGEFPPIFEIEKWLAQKGLDYSPLSVSQNIGTFGNSIYQKFQGQESNLFEDYFKGDQINPEILDKLIEAVSQNSIDKITEDLLKQLAA